MFELEPNTLIGDDQIVLRSISDIQLAIQSGYIPPEWVGEMEERVKVSGEIILPKLADY